MVGRKVRICMLCVQTRVEYGVVVYRNGVGDDAESVILRTRKGVRIVLLSKI